MYIPAGIAAAFAAGPQTAGGSPDEHLAAKTCLQDLDQLDISAAPQQSLGHCPHHHRTGPGPGMGAGLVLGMELEVELELGSVAGGRAGFGTC